MEGQLSQDVFIMLFFNISFFLFSVSSLIFSFGDSLNLLPGLSQWSLGSCNGILCKFHCKVTDFQT